MRPEHTIILPKHKAIYFAIPKNACTTLKRVCCELLNINVDEPLQVHLQRYDNFTPSFLSRARYANFYKFAFVRNPWDRLVSCYKSKIDNPPDATDHWLRNGIPQSFEGFGFRAGMPFAEFVEIVCSLDDEQSDAHFCSQWSLLSHNDRPLCSFVGKIENLEIDASGVFQMLGIPPQSLTRENTTKRKQYTEYYPAGLELIVQRRFQVDVDHFGYKFG